MLTRCKKILMAALTRSSYAVFSWPENSLSVSDVLSFVDGHQLFISSLRNGHGPDCHIDVLYLFS